MAVKVDLKKAYDRLEQSFIHKVLLVFHFPPNLVKVIMSCVSNSNISILVNASTHEPFAPLEDQARGPSIALPLHIMHGVIGASYKEKMYGGCLDPLKSFP